MAYPGKNFGGGEVFSVGPRGRGFRGGGGGGGRAEHKRIGRKSYIYKSVAYQGKNFGGGIFFGWPSVQGISGGGAQPRLRKKFMKKMRKFNKNLFLSSFNKKMGVRGAKPPEFKRFL